MQICLSTTTISNKANAGPLHQVCDDQLMSRIAVGDRMAMEALYARRHVQVYRFVLRMVHNAANAEDLTSEVFLDVWKNAGRFEGRSQVSTWILAIARHKAMSALRARIDQPIDQEILVRIPDCAEHAEAALQRQSTVDTLRQCLTQLSPSHREIIDLVYYHGRSIAEVAEIVGAPQNTVKTRMFYARKRLATLLAAHGLDAAA